jgi:hypothetical protein
MLENINLKLILIVKIKFNLKNYFHIYFLMYIKSIGKYSLF